MSSVLFPLWPFKKPCLVSNRSCNSFLNNHHYTAKWAPNDRSKVVSSVSRATTPVTNLWGHENRAPRFCAIHSTTRANWSRLIHLGYIGIIPYCSKYLFRRYKKLTLNVPCPKEALSQMRSWSTRDVTLLETNSSFAPEHDFWSQRAFFQGQTSC